LCAKPKLASLGISGSSTIHRFVDSKDQKRLIHPPSDEKWTPPLHRRAILSSIWLAAVAAAGRFLQILMALTTLSFLITTPEAWVPALGDSAHGFPFLSGTGRLVIKDAIMLGAAVTTMASIIGMSFFLSAAVS
jgi:hypothetical protein